MDTIQALCKEVKDLLKTDSVYPYAYPVYATDDCSVVSFTGGSVARAGVDYASFQISCRSMKTDAAHSNIQQVTEHFRKVLDVRLSNGDLIVQIESTQPFPYYLGQDESRRHMYVNNFRAVLVRK